MKRALMTTAALALGLGIAIPVFAQPAPGQGPGATAAAPGPAGRGDFAARHLARMCEDQDARIAGMLAYSEKKLHITDQQHDAWTKFANAVTGGEKPMQEFCTKYKGQPMPTALPQRLERAEAMMSARLEQMKQVKPALTTLYAQLTPEQQKQADHLLNGPGHFGGPGGMHHRGHEWGPGGHHPGPMGPGQHGPGMGPGMGPMGPGAPGMGPGAPAEPPSGG